MKFSLHIDPYEHAELDDRTHCATTALLRISLGEQSITRHSDLLAKSVRGDVRVAMYPLARWFAGNYWRLCYEPLQPPNATSIQWRLAHELAAAGDGYEWPFVTFAADGEDVHVWSLAAREHRHHVVQYLENARGPVPLEAFQREVLRFVREVVERLQAVDLPGTDLEKLWRFLEEESADDDARRYRIVEARLGYDPDEAPIDLVETYLDKAEMVGARAVDEIAAVYNLHNPSVAFDKLSHWLVAEGRRGRIDFPTLTASVQQHRKELPWQRGYALADEARHRAGLNGSRVSNGDLAGWLGMSEAKAFEAPDSGPTPLAGLACREDDEGNILFAPRRKHARARRFEIARLLCDHATSDRSEKWLPSTDSPTARQKMQRAFAAEFLCPIASLRSFLDGDYSDEELRLDACEHFGVQESVILQQLVNHQDLPRSVLGRDFEAGFPYAY